MSEAVQTNSPAVPADRAETEKTGSALLLRALRHRNYRLFFAGQLVSLIGTFLTQIATAWLVYSMTHKALLLGVVGFAGQIPLFVLTPFAGVWVDRINRQILLVGTQTLAMLQSFALAYLALTHQINVQEIIGLSIFQGFINAFDIPGRQAFVVEMVTDRTALPNAIALNSTMVHGARLIGPALAGLLIGWVGPGLCFLLDGMSYIAVIAALTAMRITPRVRPVPRSVLSEFADGFRYVAGFAPVRVLLVLMAVFSLTGMPAFTILMPIFGDFFGGPNHGAQTLGFLMTASGGGALVGSIYLASRRTVIGLGRVIAVGATAFGAALFAFSFSHHLWLSLLICPIAGYAMITTFASANTLLQTFVEDHMRGRVMSFFAVAFLGMSPWGNLIAGWLAATLGRSHGTGPTAARIGASYTLMIEGVICVLVAINFARKLPALRPIVRKLYVQRGILPPEVATGMQAAAEVTENAAG
jgi:MFS family permease